MTKDIQEEVVGTFIDDRSIEEDLQREICCRRGDPETMLLWK